MGGRGWMLPCLAAVALGIGAAVQAGMPSFHGEPVAQKPRVDLQVALNDGRGCGTFADQLPRLVDVQNAVARTASSYVVVCLRNAGSRSGDVALSVQDLEDVEVGCGTDESSVDASCGTGQGELSASLRQGSSTTDCGRDRPRPVVDASAPLLSDFASRPVPVADRLRAGETRCLALSTAYLPSHAAATYAAQTDRTRWRFTFFITQN
jgi:hypothetical protein